MESTINPNQQAIGGTNTRPSVLKRTFSSPLAQPALFLISFITTALTGAVMSFLQNDTGADIHSLRELYTALVAEVSTGHYSSLGEGLIFASCLLLILGTHEMGHYLTCRRHGVKATLPYFIPAPPAPMSPFGTFGAAIKIQSPFPSRKALFDIGISGPLAGFVVLIPIAFIGLLTAKAAPAPPPGTFQYKDPLLFILIIKAFGAAPIILWNPYYWAAWAGLLITALNLFPFAQLDGGHVSFALFGKERHTLISYGVFLLSILLVVLDICLHQQMTWLIWVGILYALSKLDHPNVEDPEPLGAARIILAVVALLIFILSYMPFPVGTT
ncbi:MAG TPA: site-2 protease family protein [Blastocatellia bacterium]|nr:site-2 protease family protein [Blastocatellia bacterium]